MSTRLHSSLSNADWRVLGPSTRWPGHIHVERVDGTTDLHVLPHHILGPNVRTTDPITSHQAARSQTPAKVRSEHRLVLELLRWEPLTDFDLAERASQTLQRKVKSVSIGKRRGELRDLGLVADSGLKGRSDTGFAAVRWCLTDAGHKELAA